MDKRNIMIGLLVAIFFILLSRRKHIMEGWEQRENKICAKNESSGRGKTPGIHMKIDSNGKLGQGNWQSTEPVHNDVTGYFDVKFGGYTWPKNVNHCKEICDRPTIYKENDNIEGQICDSFSVHPYGIDGKLPHPNIPISICMMHGKDDTDWPETHRTPNWRCFEDPPDLRGRELARSIAEELVHQETTNLSSENTEAETPQVGTCGHPIEGQGWAESGDSGMSLMRDICSHSAAWNTDHSIPPGYPRKPYLTIDESKLNHKLSKKASNWKELYNGGEEGDANQSWNEECCKVIKGSPVGTCGHPVKGQDWIGSGEVGMNLMREICSHSAAWNPTPTSVPPGYPGRPDITLNEAKVFTPLSVQASNWTELYNGREPGPANQAWNEECCRQVTENEKQPFPLVNTNKVYLNKGN